MRRSLALLACLTPILALSHAAFSQDEPVSKLRLGPAVTIDGDALAVEVTVAEGLTGVALRATWGENLTATAPFEAVPKTKKLRAKLPASLPASAKVHYEVVAGNETLASKDLVTLPARDAKRFTWCALGDSGYPDRGENRACTEQIQVARLLAQVAPDVAIHTGDVIYLVGQEEGVGPLFFAPYAGTLARVPLFCCLGNHDVKTDDGAPELASFPFPTNPNGNRFYSFDVANVHFVALDSNEPLDDPDEFVGSPQGKWLKADLAASRADWKVAFFHHPLYSAFPKRKVEQRALQRGCEKTLLEGGVDICVNGHDHFYHRTPAVLAGKKDERGIVHVLTGGGGAPLYPPEPGDLTAAYFHGFHLVRFRVDGLRMKLEALGPVSSGDPRVVDSCEIVSRKERKAD